LDWAFTGMAKAYRAIIAVTQRIDFELLPGMDTNMGNKNLKGPDYKGERCFMLQYTKAQRTSVSSCLRGKINKSESRSINVSQRDIVIRIEYGASIGTSHHPGIITAIYIGRRSRDMYSPDAAG
jgi:hypothetical protein